MREDCRGHGKTGSAHAFYPNHFAASSKNRPRSMVKVLVFLVCVLTCATTILLALYLRARWKDGQGTRKADDVCVSRACVQAAESVAKKMDPSADPCDDFAQFACGNFYNTATFSEGMTSVSTFTLLRHANDKLIKTIVSEEENSSERLYVKNLKRLYRSCMDEDAIERIGLSPYLDSRFAKQWPTLIGRNWSEVTNFDLNEVNSDYMSVGIQPLFAVEVILDPMDASRKTIALVDPDLPYAVLLRRSRDSAQVQAYERVLRDLAMTLGADPELAAQDATAVVDLEMALSKTIVPHQERRRNISNQMNVFTLEALAEKYKMLDIRQCVRSVFATANITLEDSQQVLVPFPQVLEQIFSVALNTSTRTLQNLFSFQHAFSQARGVTRRMREQSLSLEKVLSGKREARPRAQVCLGQVRKAFPFAIGKEFIRRKNFSQDAKIYVNSMIDNLKVEFENQLRSITWMGNKTKAEAFQKLALMTRQVAYPDTNFSEEDIDKDSEQFTMKAGKFYENLQTLKAKYRLAALREVEEQTDKHTWAGGPHMVNAFYSRLNSIFLPAGLLQAPFFSLQYPHALNYGSIGHVIGHEMLHGFDDIGSQFDLNGNFRNWWQPQDKKNFAQSCQCIVQQYSSFYDDVTGLNVNGLMTQGENVADNGGLKQSFRAYKSLVARQGEQGRLPGLNLTNDQIFFLAYAQLWCEKSTTLTRRREMQTLNHPIGEFRILGPLQNLPEFSTAYQCPAGSRMNPHRKCSVW